MVQAAGESVVPRIHTFPSLAQVPAQPIVQADLASIIAVLALLWALHCCYRRAMVQYLKENMLKTGKENGEEWKRLPGLQRSG